MKFYNEHKEEIPSDIVHKAEAIGCYSVKYIYKNGKKYRPFPAPNLNITKESRAFRKDTSAEKHKIILGCIDGVEWVVYKSPKGSKNKGLITVEDPSTEKDKY